MNLGRSAKTVWIQKKDKTELILACRFISKGLRCLKWSHVFNYRIYRIIILLRMVFIMSSGFFQSWSQDFFSFAFPLIHFVLGGVGVSFCGFCKAPRDNFDCQRRFLNKDSLNWIAAKGQSVTAVIGRSCNAWLNLHELLWQPNCRFLCFSITWKEIHSGRRCKHPTKRSWAWNQTPKTCFTLCADTTTLWRSSCW